jgi:hypothetical protein
MWVGAFYILLGIWWIISICKDSLFALGWESTHVVFWFFFFLCGTGAWTQGLHLEPFHQPFFVKGFFEIGSRRTMCLGWLGTSILLISASWLARITGMSHQSPATCSFLYNFLYLFLQLVFVRNDISYITLLCYLYLIISDFFTLFWETCPALYYSHKIEFLFSATIILTCRNVFCSLILFYN